MKVKSKNKKTKIIYSNMNESAMYAYKDKECTIKYSKNELEKLFKNNRDLCFIDDGTNKMNSFVHAMYSEDNFCYLWVLSYFQIYSSEYIKETTS